LTGVTGEHVVVLVTENTKAKIGSIGDEDEVLVTEETIGCDSPMRLGVGKVGDIGRIRGKSREDVAMKLVLVHNDGST
jgi:hypothetical protein